MHVYVTVSKNHNIPLDEVIRGKFTPVIRMLIMYYNHQFQLEKREYEKMEEERKQMERKNNMKGV